MRKILLSIFNRLPLSVRVWIFRKFFWNDKCGYGEKFSTYISNAFSTFLNEDDLKDKGALEKLTDDIVSCWLQYKALPYEYFLFGFPELSASQRAEFLTDMDRIITLRKASDYEGFKRDINNKYNFYKHTKEYFHREAILVDKEHDAEDFVSFARSRSEVFVKPVASSKGAGAKLHVYVNDQASKDFRDALLKEEEAWIVEEKIVQHPEMSQWNPTSVNTIRIPTFLRNGEFTVLWTRMRTGKKGAIVDNAGSGGIIVMVDPVTGIINSNGVDEAFNHYEKHPDNGMTFCGWQVPHWQELLEVAEKLHREKFPKQVYIAWDFALTENGWVVVEGNWGQMLGQQTASQIGVSRKFHELVGR